MKRDYYNKYYDLERSHWWFRARLFILRTCVEREFQTAGKGSLNILNVGAATGATSEMLQEFGTVTTLEYDEDCCEVMRTKCGLHVDQGSVLELPYDDRVYDLVCAFDVIEHLDEDELAMREMARVCKNSGFVFITVPAFNFLWSRHDDINDHKRRYTSGMLRGVGPQGGHWSYVSYFNSFLFVPVALLRFLQHLTRARSRQGPSESDFALGRDWTLVNNLLEKVFKLEASWIKRHRKFPVGISLLGTWKKDSAELQNSENRNVGEVE